MIEITCKIDPKTKREDGYCLAEGHVKVNGNANDVANELRVIITMLEKQVGEDTFAAVLDDWLRYEKGFK